MIDLSSHPPVELNCDVCIIGAGVAGCYLAARLAGTGLDVILLEAGKRNCETPQEAGFVPEFAKAEYLGALNGRAFGVGGSSSRWGGVLAPFGQQDIRASKSLELTEIWTSIVATVDRERDEVLKNLGNPRDENFFHFAEQTLGKPMLDELQAIELQPLAALVLPFRLKNFSRLLANSPGVRAFYGAAVSGWKVQEGQDAAIDSIRLTNKAGLTHTVRAKRYAVCAGALESTRMLLELQDQVPSLCSRLGADLGRCLGDHLSITIADVSTDAAKQVINNYAPRFDHGWMRTYRFLEAMGDPLNPRYFCHFIFDVENPGFMLAKEMLNALQQKRRPQISAGELISGLAGLGALGATRYLKNRLYIPPNTSMHLQLDMEQAAKPNNAVSLGDAKDTFGRKILRISWDVDDADKEQLARTAAHVLQRWSLAGLPRLNPRRLDDFGEKPHDAFHPVGSCRMGVDSAAVVDSALKVRGIENMWVASTAVFPTAGSANPTFSLLCHVNALAKALQVHKK